jgi:phosphoglycolate phosphatase-like HAD superfamily hydrolase
VNKELKGVEALAWDLDGTLIDSFELYLELVAEIAQHRGHTLPSRQELAKNYHGSLQDSLTMAFGLRSESEMKDLVEEFVDLQHLHYEHDVDGHFYGDAVRLANKASQVGMRQIVITNRDHAGRKNASPRSIIERSAIADFIQDVRCGDEVVARKPDPRALDDWLAAHSVAPERLVVVGDQFVDALLAINLGAKAVLASRNGEIHHLEQLGSNWEEHVVVVESLDEIEL